MIRHHMLSDLDEMARLHSTHFLRSWSKDELTKLLEEPGVFSFVYDNDIRCAGFIILRVVAEEGEIFTLIVNEKQQRQGIATALLEYGSHALLNQGITTLFLEVAEDNIPALKLYEKSGFITNGRRRGYYPRLGRTRADALLMHRTMQPVAHFS